MVTRAELMKRTGLIGGGIGLALFAVFGLLQGAALGGAAGVSIANHIFGEATLKLLADELLPRIIVVASMLAGVIVSCLVFVVAGACLGVAAGFLLSLLYAPAHAPEAAPARVNMPGLANMPAVEEDGENPE